MQNYNFTTATIVSIRTEQNQKWLYRVVGISTYQLKLRRIVSPKSEYALMEDYWEDRDLLVPHWLQEGERVFTEKWNAVVSLIDCIMMNGVDTYVVDVRKPLEVDITSYYMKNLEQEILKIEEYP